MSLWDTDIIYPDMEIETDDSKCFWWEHKIPGSTLVHLKCTGLHVMFPLFPENQKSIP